MGGNFQWVSDTPEFFSGAMRPAHGAKRHVVVECLPGGGWDWVAWSNDGSGFSSHGRADTLGKAIGAAEHGAMTLGQAPRQNADANRPCTEG